MPRLYETTGKQWQLSLRPGGRGLMAGMETVPAAQEGMMAGWTWMLVETVFAFSSLLSPTVTGETLL